MTNAPMRRKRHPLTFRPALRTRISQRMLASDPVTERFGPRSTPSNTAFAKRAMNPGVLYGGSGGKAQWQVIDEVVGQADEPADDQRALPRRPVRCSLQSMRGDLQQPSPVGGPRRGRRARRPGAARTSSPRRRARAGDAIRDGSRGGLPPHDEHKQQRRGAGWSAEIVLQSRGGQ